jgi:DNA-binding PadR family transcriptional regulator
MSQPTSLSRNLWALTVLCLLREGPMHPYEMQRLIRERKKDEYLDLKRGSLYHAISRLQTAGLIEPVETHREGRRPERTIYRSTESGRLAVLTWLRELLARPLRETSPFFAAVSFLLHLSPEDVVAQLESRATLLEAEVDALDTKLRDLIPRIGRIILLEAEYTRAMRQAELTWVRSLIDDIRAGKETWSPEVLFEYLSRARQQTQEGTGPTPPEGQEPSGQGAGA